MPRTKEDALKAKLADASADARDDDSEDESEYDIDEILDLRLDDDGNLQGFHKWKDHPDAENTWEKLDPNDPACDWVETKTHVLTCLKKLPKDHPCIALGYPISTWSAMALSASSGRPAAMSERAY